VKIVRAGHAAAARRAASAHSASASAKRPAAKSRGLAAETTQHAVANGAYTDHIRGTERQKPIGSQDLLAPDRPEDMMPIATPDIYRSMLDRAKRERFAYPAINVTSSETVSAALRGFAEAQSDGIIQLTPGGAEFASGIGVQDAALGARAMAEFAHRVGDRSDVFIALHTDHCPPNKLESFLSPLLAESRARRRRGEPPLFGSHMFDGSTLPLEQNLDMASQLLAQCAELGIILELEIGVVGGEEDGISGEGVANAQLYSTPQDMLTVTERLGTGERGRYLLAATFGNVHGVYQPGHVQLRPSILRDGQEALRERYGSTASFDFVFHGGSGSSLQDIQQAVSYGVVKMNVDTDTQYAFTRPIADHMFKNYSGVLKVDGGVGDKRAYDPRRYLTMAQLGMAERVVQACQDLGSAGRSLMSNEA
jgi:fructose-bisphosphate aldolase, class II